MHKKHIIQALPLLASALGRKYGVEIQIGGDTACTDGKTIYLPALPMEADDNFLGLVRGYMDHEFAHIRYTDFKGIKDTRLSPLEKYIWNILEDWRVEHTICKFYPGCRSNFDWLIRHLFLEKTQGNPNPDAGSALLEWLLLTVRSWDVPELEKKVFLLQQANREVTLMLHPLLIAAQTACVSTATTISHAKKIVATLKDYLKTKCDLLDKQSGTAGKNQMQKALLEQLEALFKYDEQMFPDDLGKIIGNKLSGVRVGEERLAVATVTSKECLPFELAELAKVQQATTAMRTRLCSALQSVKITRSRTSYQGELNTKHLYKLAINQSKIFKRKGLHQAFNTAVHILLDCSGSMHGEALDLASQACFSIASVLHAVRGVNLGLTAFPGAQVVGASCEKKSWSTIAPILSHGQRLHSNFKFKACGSTPTAEALWWVLQEMQNLPELRKIIFLITDGYADNQVSAKAAIETAGRLGYEVYAVGINTDALKEILPAWQYLNITALSELAPKMFSILQNALCIQPQSKAQ